MHASASANGSCHHLHLNGCRAAFVMLVETSCMFIAQSIELSCSILRQGYCWPHVFVHPYDEPVVTTIVDVSTVVIDAG